MDYEIISISTSDKQGKHLSKRAWDESRPNSDAALSDIMRVNAPVNEMPSVLLNIYSSVIEREVIAGIREHSMWASTSRVDNIWDFELVEGTPKSGVVYAEECRSAMIMKKVNGVKQDQFRLHLPMTAETHYFVRLNMRACAILHMYFLHLATLNHETAEIFNTAASDFKAIAMEMGMEDPTVYGFVDILGESVHQDNENFSRQMGSFTMVKHWAPFSLRAHMIRHRLIFLRDGLTDWIRDGIHLRSMGDKISIEAVASNDSWRGIYSKRSCWIAQADLWNPLLRLIINEIGGTKDLLPCADGSCPFEKDASLRLEVGKDPNPPCPRHAELNGIKLNDEQMNSIKSEIESGDREDIWREYTNG
jgi:hypothetical protein